jgi:predicted dehydrogenase
MKQLVVKKQNPEPILLDTPTPQAGPGEVVIKNQYSVVSSGTELAAIESANKGVSDKLQNSSNIEKGIDLLRNEGVKSLWNAVFPKNISPLQLGYSSAGEVIEVGKGVTRFHVGDLVASNGGHAEYVVVNENLCSRVPEGVDVKEAAFTTLSSIALHGLRLSNTTLGSKIVVIGLGVVGQLVCKLAEAQGSEVIGIDPDESRSSQQSNFYSSVDEVELVNIDSVIITAATSSNEPIEVATKIARNKARIVVVGDIPLQISRNDFYYKELELVVSKSYGPGRYDKQYEVLGKDYPIEYVRWTENRNFETCLKLISSQKLNVLDLVSEEIAFEDAPSVYSKFGSEKKPLSVVLRYDIKSEPKIDFLSTDENSNNNDKVKLGIIGAGNFASTTILPVLKELKKEAEILGIASASGLRSETLAKNFKIKNKYPTENEILESDEIDAVLILTPHNTHSDLVIKALAKGKAIYVEKPLALLEKSLVEIEEALFNAENPKLFIGFNRRFSESIEFIKNRSLTKEINSLTFRFSVPPLDSDHWTNIREIGGGRIVGEAIHAIDLACYLFESLPQSISSSAPVNKELDQANENQVFVDVNFVNGSHASINYFSETNQMLSKERIEMHGSGNSYILEDFQLLRYLEAKEDRSKVFKNGKGHKESLKTFFEYVRGEIENPFTWQEIKAVSRAGIYAQDNINSGKHHIV